MTAKLRHGLSEDELRAIANDPEKLMAQFMSGNGSESGSPPDRPVKPSKGRQAAQRVVTGNRLLMMTLSAVYGNAPSPIPVPPKFSSVGCNGRALTSVFMASIQTQ